MPLTTFREKVTYSLIGIVLFAGGFLSGIASDLGDDAPQITSTSTPLNDARGFSRAYRNIVLGGSTYGAYFDVSSAESTYIDSLFNTLGSNISYARLTYGYNSGLNSINPNIVFITHLDNAGNEVRNTNNIYQGIIRQAIPSNPPCPRFCDLGRSIIASP